MERKRKTGRSEVGKKKKGEKEYEKGDVRGEKAFIMFPRSTIRTWRQRDLECEFTHSIYVSGTQGIWL